MQTFTLTVLALVLAPGLTPQKPGDAVLRKRILADIGKGQHGGRMGILSLAKDCPICRQGYHRIGIREQPTFEGPYRLTAWICKKDRLYFLKGQGGMTTHESGPFVLPSRKEPKKAATKDTDEAVVDLRPMPFGGRRLLASKKPDPKWQAVWQGQDLTLSAGGGHDSTLHVWKDKGIITDRGVMGVTALAFAPKDNAVALARSGGHIKVWSLPDGKLKADIKGPFANYAALVLDPTARLLAAVSFEGAKVKLEILQLPGGKVLRRLDADGMQGPTSAAWSSDGRYLAIGDARGTIRCWNVGKGRLTARNKVGARVLHALFTPDNSRVAVLSDFGAKTQLVAVISGKVTAAFGAGEPLQYCRNSLGELAFSPDGRRIVWSRADGVMVMGDMATGKTIRKSLGAARLSRLRFRDNKTLVTGFRDGSRLEWNTASFFPIAAGDGDGTGTGTDKKKKAGK